MPDDKTIDRIRKLLALAGNNPSPEEAEVALKRAHSLLLKHGLSVHDIGEAHEKLVERLTDTWYGAPWVRELSQAIAKLYFCRFYSTHAPRGQRHFNFVGTAANIQVSRDIAHWLTYAIYREGRRQDKLSGKKGFHTAFCRHATFRIRERVDAIIEESKIEQADVGGGVSKSLVVANYYNEMEDRNTEWLAKAGVHIKMIRSSRRGGKVQSGREAGYDYGNSLGLNRQVSGSRQRRLK